MKLRTEVAVAAADVAAEAAVVEAAAADVAALAAAVEAAVPGETVTPVSLTTATVAKLVVIPKAALKAIDGDVSI